MEGDLVFYVNGSKVIEKNPDPKTTLATYIRKDLDLTGTKLSCEQGGCGTCTVLVSRYDQHNSVVRHFTVNSCLVPLCWAHGTLVTTIEGLGSTDTKLDPLQKCIAEHHGSQCGFCTPGMVMSMCGLFCNEDTPTDNDIEDTLADNLCRCTGYRPIFEAYASLSKQTNGTKYTKTIDFPADLQSDSFTGRSVTFHSRGGSRWHHVTSLPELLSLVQEHPAAPLAQGCSGLIWQLKYKVPPVIISSSCVPELHQIKWTNAGLLVGAGVSPTTLIQFIQQDQSDLPAEKKRMIAVVEEMYPKIYASSQIRNISTFGGSIAGGSSRSDTVLLLSAMRATINLQSKDCGLRQVTMDESYCTDLRAFRKPGEIITSVLMPFSSQMDHFWMNKEAPRPNAKYPYNLAMKLSYSDRIERVQSMSMRIGGLSRSLVIPVHTQVVIQGRKVDKQLSTDMLAVLRTDLKDIVPRAKISLVTRTIRNTLMSFIKRVTGEDSSDKAEKLPGLSAVQVFEPVPADQKPEDAVGRPMVHKGAYQQATGEARYLDDLPELKGELHLVFVTSTKAHAKILSVDTSKALSVPGVRGVLDHNDLPGKAKGPFATTEVMYYGEPVLAVIADTLETATAAARLVRVEYEPLPHILSLEEAVARGSIFPWERSAEIGDLAAGFDAADHLLEGTVQLGGQEHYYLETQGCLVIPAGEDRELQIIAGTQGPCDLQEGVAAALEIDANRIEVKMKRTGGGFGGKEIIPTLLAIAAGAAALRYRKPVRCILDRATDMAMSGTRPAYLAKYKVGFKSTGKLTAVDVDLFSNGGAQNGQPKYMMDVAVQHMDSCYNFPAVRTTGRVCQTHVAPRRAARGFGNTESHLITESWLTKVADFLNMPQYQIRQVNFYKDGDRTIKNEIVEHFRGKECWDQVLEESNYHQKLVEIHSFNRTHSNKKRGISAIPVRFPVGMGATLKSATQATALVHVYKDGTVRLSHNGIEMGQGLHTKMIQVASRALGIPASLIYIAETNTSVTANGTMTCASQASDLNGGAVIRACETLKARLASLSKDFRKEIQWKELVNLAYNKRIPLSAVGHFKQEGFDDFDYTLKTTNKHTYYTYGAGVSVVELDCATGSHVVLSTELLMDVGKSLNPAIDIGQIEGAFVMMYGALTTEELTFAPDGRPLSTGPGSYSIPGMNNIPRQMNVTLLKDSPNPYQSAVYSSKGIGEPPMTLAGSAFLAIRMAVKAAREENGFHGDFEFNSPATAEKTLLACVNESDFANS